MSNMYDEIMHLLHEADAFAECSKQKKVAQAVRHTRQIAETELQPESSRLIRV
jgi:hypothetical protein